MATITTRKLPVPVVVPPPEQTEVTLTLSPEEVVLLRLLFARNQIVPAHLLLTDFLTTDQSDRLDSLMADIYMKAF